MDGLRGLSCVLLVAPGSALSDRLEAGVTLHVSRRSDPERTYAPDHDASLSRRMERGKMPRTLTGLVAWYMALCSDELPDRLHKGELWHDQDSIRHREFDGRHSRGLGCACQPDRVFGVGGSVLGTPAWSGLFRARLEGSPSMIDEDGMYRFPIAAALSRLHRRRPLMARNLVSLAMASGDWRVLATAGGWPLEMYEDYIEAALRCLWAGTYDRVVRGVA